MKYAVTLLLLLFACANSGPSYAAIVGYEFKGLVIQLDQPPYGFTVPPFSPVVGRFYYDTNTVRVGDSSIGNYRQTIPNGFWATVGPVSVSTDSYIVQVSNHLLQQGTPNFADVVSIAWSSDISPALPSPLVVNGTSQTTGMFNVNFIGSDSLYDDTHLPTTLSANSFPTKIGLFADTPTGFVDVLFTITSITSLTVVPEPQSSLLLSLGVLAFLKLRRTWG
jgi:hypothetical protein